MIGSHPAARNSGRHLHAISKILSPKRVRGDDSSANSAAEVDNLKEHGMR
jgi:hypothetical protein